MRRRGSDSGGYAGAVVDSKSCLRRGLQTAAVAALLGNAGVASALGFGTIRVHSALNEPLNATINLVALTPEEKTALQVDMASADMFRRFGIQRTSLADRIRIVAAPGNEDSQVLLRLTTDAPVQEPFLRFLIEADTGSGRALREYTVLLDPPGQAPAGTQAGTQVQPQTEASAPQPGAANPRPRASQQPTPARSPANAGPAAGTASSTSAAEPVPDRYGPVQAGETLSRIAADLRRPGTTLDQMQVAIYRNNPQAFSDNMNILLRGAMLSVPPVERIRAIENGEARAVVRQQQAEAMERLAQADAATAVDRAGPTADVSSATTDARLRLEPSRIDGRGEVGTAGFGRLAMPDFDSAGNETGPATPATTEVGEAGQGEADPGEADPMVAEGGATPDSVAPSTGSVGEVDATTSTGSPVDDAGNTAAVDNDTAVADTAEPTAPGTTSPAESPDTLTGNTAEPALTTDSENDGVDSSSAVAVDGDDVNASEGGDYRPLPSSDTDVVGASGTDGLLRPRNLLLFAGGLGLVGLLLAWRRRRQYKPVPLHFEAEGGHAAEPTVDEPLPAAGEPRQAHIAPAPDTGRPSQRIERAETQIKAGEFDQARETLEAGLKEHPNDSALQDKRLELDYLTGDDQAFMANIERFGTALSDNGVRWAGVASMGRVLRPQDPRFALGLEGDSPAATPAEEDGSAQPDAESADALYDSFMSSNDSGLDDELPPVPEEDDAAAERFFSIDESSDDVDPAPTPSARGEDAAAQGQGRRDTAADMDGFEWEDQKIEGGDEREHDQGDEPGLTFDLDSPRESAPKPEPKSIQTIDTDGFDLDDGSDNENGEDGDTDPVEIRLDLARMYIEMEDNTAARELLEDVQKEGDETQRATATELLNKL
ncbi:MAG: hypothetical protein CMN27_07780 [Salinisphaera sp.]|nr:hypothetical protein [Salinisphaera sp.]